MHRLVLFDIDNTLISIGSGNLPQQRAMNRAFELTRGIPDVFEDVAFTGGIDLPLMMEVYRKWDLMPEESDTLPDTSAFQAAYFDHLARNLDDWTGGGVCPGVPELLEALSSDGWVRLGLETGNFREAAFIKLRRYGLDGYFQYGGFGGDHMEKWQVVAAAIERCQETSGQVYGPGEPVSETNFKGETIRIWERMRRLCSVRWHYIVGRIAGEKPEVALRGFRMLVEVGDPHSGR